MTHETGKQRKKIGRKMKVRKDTNKGEKGEKRAYI